MTRIWKVTYGTNLESRNFAAASFDGLLTKAKRYGQTLNRIWKSEGMETDITEIRLIAEA